MNFVPPRWVPRKYSLQDAAPGTDILFAAGLAAIGVAEVVAVLGPDHQRAWVVALAASAPLIWRRELPHVTALLTTLVLVVQLPLPSIRIFDQTFTGYVCLLIATYSVGRHGGRSAPLVGSSCAAAAALTIGLNDADVVSGVLALALVLAPVGMGRAVRNRARLRHLLEEQTAELEAGADVAARRAAVATRASVAGDVQDVVDRKVGDMMVQIAVARSRVETDRPGAVEAIASVESQGRLALTAMRSLVRVLRDSDRVTPSSVPGPAPSFHDVPEAVAPSAAVNLRRADPWATIALIVVCCVEYASSAQSLAAQVLAFCAGGAVAAPLLLRHRSPVGASVAGWTAAGALAHVLPLPTNSLALLAPWFAYAVGAWAADGLRRGAGLVVGLGGVLAVNLLSGSTQWGDYVFPWLLVALGWLAGRLMAQQSRLTAVATERAQQVDRLRRAKSDMVATEERLRIARELHDVAAHTIMIMVVQAGAARRTLLKGGTGWAEALDIAERTGASASNELRRMLSLVDPGADRAAPASGLDGVPALVERIRAAGLEVDLRLEGPVSDLPDALQLAAYRIVQEALTNTLRHADASRVSVLVRRGCDELDLRVRDNGRPSGLGVTPGGSGIDGMRERARLSGGDVCVGPDGDDGFLVAATLPFRGRARDRA